MPFTPAALRASFTWSSLKGLMTAVISCMVVSWSGPLEGGATAAVVRRLCVLCEVEAAGLHVLRDSHADGGLEGQHDHRRHDERVDDRSEEHTSELQSLMSISYAVYCLNK